MSNLVAIEPPSALRERLLARRQITESGCWLWLGSTSGGYGQITFLGKHLHTHRASWIAHRGPIPEGALICHRCDVRNCINPDHLYVGTYRDNRRDMLERSGWAHPYGKRDTCANGHSYELGFRIAKDGSRVCKTCMREHMRNFRQRSKNRG